MSTAPRFILQYVGQGFSPVTESLKGMVIDTQNGKMVETPIGGTPYSVAESVQYLEESEVSSAMVTQDSSQSYASNKRTEYGFDDDFPLFFPLNVASNGRWIQTDFSSGQKQKFRFVFENTLGTFQITDPIKFLTKRVSDDLAKLPRAYNDSTKRMYTTIIDRYGTHIIIEQKIGGSLEIETTMENRQTRSSSLRQYSTNISYLFASISNNSMDSKSTQFQSQYASSKLYLKGGMKSGVNTVKDLTPDTFQKWSDSITLSPEGLNVHFKLFPLSGLAVEPQASYLRQATIDYLSKK